MKVLVLHKGKRKLVDTKEEPDYRAKYTALDGSSLVEEKKKKKSTKKSTKKTAKKSKKS